MLHLIPARRVWTVVWLAVLVATPALLPGTATAQDGASGPGLSPRLLADASWHGRPIQRPLPRRRAASDRSPALRPGTGFRRPGGSRRVRDVQRRLTRLGYKPGVADGLFGPRTRAAVLAFQRKHGLPRTGAAGPDTLRVLRRRTAQGATGGPAQPSSASPARPAPAPTSVAATEPRAPATPAASTSGFPLLAAILMLALALPVLTATALLVRRRTTKPARLPAHRPLLLGPPPPPSRELLPSAPLRRDPAVEPEANRAEQHDTMPEDERRNAQGRMALYEAPRITRRAPLPHASPEERRVALRERILAMRAEGMTLQAIADQLTEEGEVTLGGGRRWQPWNVRTATRPINPRSRTPTQGRRGST